MKQTSVDIDRVVREVLARLTDAPVARDADETDTDPQDLVLDCRLVTLSQLEGRLDGIRRVVVPHGAVITPSARDELRQRKIGLSRDCPGSESELLSSSTGSSRLVMVTTEPQFDPAKWLDTLDVDSRRTDCLIEAVEMLAAEVAKPDTLGLLWTVHVAAGLCLANRRQGVRAVTGRDAPSLRAAAESVGANVAVVDPTGVSTFQLKQIAIEFCRGPVRSCPVVFQKHLA